MNIEHIGTVAPQTSTERRRSRVFGTHLIKANFQFKFSLMVFLLLASVALFVWIQGSLTIQKLVFSGQVSEGMALIHLKYLNGIVGKTFMLGLALTFGLSLFFSHFVAGPIYRFQRVLSDIKGGRLNLHVQLRKHDELKDVADSFNQALSSLRNKLREERDSINSVADQIEPLIQKLRKANRNAEASDLERILSEIKNNPPQIQI